MHTVQRAYVSVCAALATAGVIAVTPVSPVISPPAPIQLQARTVELTAATDPLVQWAGIITRTVTEASQLGQIIAANPAPILQQIAQNQLANADMVSNALQAFANGAGRMLDPSNPNGTAGKIIEAVRYLQEGDPVAASQAVWNGILGFFYQALLPLNNLTSIPASMATNFGKAVTAIAMVPYTIGFVTIGIAHAPFQAFEETSVAVTQALENQDPAAAATALLSFPGRVVDFAVNGYGTGNVRLGGLLGVGGLVYSLNSARTSIAAAIAPPAPEEPIAERTTVAIGAPTSRTTLTATNAAPSDSESGVAPTERADAQTPPTALATKITATSVSEIEASPTEKAVRRGAVTPATPAAVVAGADRTDLRRTVNANVRTSVKHATDGLKKALASVGVKKTKQHSAEGTGK